MCFCAIYVGGLPSALSVLVLTNQDFVWAFALVISGLMLQILVIKYGSSKFRSVVINDYGTSDWYLPKFWEWIIKYVIDRYSGLITSKALLSFVFKFVFLWCHFTNGELRDIGSNKGASYKNGTWFNRCHLTERDVVSDILMHVLHATKRILLWRDLLTNS